MKDNQTVLKDSERSSCIDKHHDLAEEAVKSYNPDVKTTTLIPELKEIWKTHWKTISLSVFLFIIVVTLIVTVIQMNN
jgi:hypothetical protein